MRRVVDDVPGRGVGVVETFTVVADELRPNARYSAPSETNPRMIAAIILFRSVELFPANSFIASNAVTGPRPVQNLGGENTLPFRDAG